MKNARFWTWINDGWVKLTLRPGESLQWFTWNTHNEGWSSECVEWSLEDDVVTRTTETDGSDCDGRLSRSYIDECGIGELASVPAMIQCEFDEEWDGWKIDLSQPKRPDWQKVRSGQRDYAAEAAGY